MTFLGNGKPRNGVPYKRLGICWELDNKLTLLGAHGIASDLFHVCLIRPKGREVIEFTRSSLHGWAIAAWEQHTLLNAPLVIRDGWLISTASSRCCQAVVVVYGSADAAVRYPARLRHSASSGADCF